MCLLYHVSVELYTLDLNDHENLAPLTFGSSLGCSQGRCKVFPGMTSFEVAERVIK